MQPQHMISQSCVNTGYSVHSIFVIKCYEYNLKEWRPKVKEFCKTEKNKEKTRTNKKQLMQLRNIKMRLIDETNTVEKK